MPDAGTRASSIGGLPRGASATAPQAASSYARLPPLLSSSEILELSRLDAVVSLQRWWKHRRRHNHRRVAELSDQLRAYAESLIQKKRQARIRAKIRDIVVHVVFLAVYTVSCHRGYTSEHLYRLVHATTREYRERAFDTVQQRHYDAIATPADLFAWLRGPFLSATYPSPWSATSTYTNPQLTNRIVGGIRIGQLRVPRQNCSLRISAYYPSALMDDTDGATPHGLDCYGTYQGDFDVDEEAIEAFGGAGSIFPFEGLNGTSTTTERSELFSSMKASNTRTLPSPAFSIVLPRANKTEAEQLLTMLEDHAYVDLQTRVVMVDVNFFNVMLRYTMALRFLIEFPSSGGAVATLHVSTAPLTKSFLIGDDDDDVGWTLCNLAVLVFYAYFLFSEIALQTNRQRRRRALPSSSGKALHWSSRNGSMLRVLSLGLYFVVWLLRLFTLLKAPSSFPLHTSSEYVRLRPYGEAFRVSQYLLGLNTCVCWWMLILLLRVVTYVDVFVRSLELAAPRLLTLLLCLTILLYGYASAFLLVAGAESAPFRSIPQAMATLLLLLFGSSTGATTAHYSTMQMLLFACFLLLNVFVISNLFLAVVYDSYRQALDHAEHLRTTHDQFNLPLETFNYCRAGIDRLVERIARVARRLVPAPKLPVSDKLKRFSVVHAVSKSNVITKSTKLVVGKAEELARLGDKLVQNVAAGLGDGDRDLLIEHNPATRRSDTGANNYGSGVRRRRPESGRGMPDQTVKLLQGMLLQLAIQNETLQRSVDDLRREMQHSSGDGVAGSSSSSTGGVGTSVRRQSNRTASNAHVRGRVFALNRPGNEDEDDEDDDDDMDDQDDVHVVDSPAELTAIQSM